VAELAEVIEVYAECLCRFRHRDLRSALAKRVERADDRVVLKWSGDHPVTGFYQPF
jgi:hypothetical protein